MRISRRSLLVSLTLALAMAAAESTADVWVMAPMIATAQEARDFAARARALGLRHVAMVVCITLVILVLVTAGLFVVG